MNLFSQYIFFLILLIMIYMFIGQKPAFYLLGLILLGMFVLNSENIKSTMKKYDII